MIVRHQQIPWRLQNITLPIFDGVMKTVLHALPWLATIPKNTYPISGVILYISNHIVHHEYALVIAATLKDSGYIERFWPH